MKQLLRRYSIILALLIFWAPRYGHAQPAPVVRTIEVKHVGPAAVSDDLIRANIRVKIGDPLNKNSVNDDVRNLYGTGYFYNIRVVEERQTSGVKLTYVVQGKPVLTDIRITGNKKYSDKKLRKKITSKVGDPLDERKLFADAQSMQEMYRKAGYQKTTVKYLPPAITESTGRGTVTFEVVEAPKVKIRRVDFVGAENFSEKQLRKEIETRRRWAFSWLTGSGILKEDEFEDDKRKLIDFYREEGYIDARIDKVEFEYPEEKWMVIKIHLTEGRQWGPGTHSRPRPCSRTPTRCATSTPPRVTLIPGWSHGARPTCRPERLTSTTKSPRASRSTSRRWRSVGTPRPRTRSSAAS
jgi:outer membrane protein insertion porin family